MAQWHRPVAQRWRNRILRSSASAPAFAQPAFSCARPRRACSYGAGKTCRRGLPRRSRLESEPPPPRRTSGEQCKPASHWRRFASPLPIGWDITKLDDFTLALFTNGEVLDVNQDPLGRQAARVAKQGRLEVWAKVMANGSKAVGLFNRGEGEAEAVADWATLGLTGGAHRSVGRVTEAGSAGVGSRKSEPLAADKPASRPIKAISCAASGDRAIPRANAGR